MQTTSNEQLTNDLLKTLAAAAPPCITVTMAAGGKSKVHMSSTLREVEEQLGKSDIPPALLERFREAVPQSEARTGTGSIVLLISADHQHVFTAPEDLPARIVVGDEFHLRSLLPLLRRKADFYILALSQQHTRLLHCTESTSGEVALPPDAPTDFMEFRQTRQPDHVLDNRGSAGPSVGSMKGVLSATSSDRDEKDRFHHDFYRAIDRGVNAVLSGTGAPLVVTAVEHELALYQSVNTYADIVEPGIRGAPDGLKGGEMHRRALDLLASYQPAVIRRELEHFEKNAGTGHASSHAQEIIRAAYEGRVSFLFLQENAEYQGAFDEVRRKVKHHEDGITPLRDLLNDAAVQTLRHSGEVCLLSAKEMPNGVPVCAVFRYPSPELQAAIKNGVA